MSLLPRLLLALLVALPMSAVASPAATSSARTAPAATSERALIEALIGSVERSKHLHFIRNGSEHDGKAAAEHLRLKWRKAGERVRTADDFIRYCASASTMSGKKYQIRQADGRTVDAADYFQEKLRALRKAQATPAG